MTQPVTLNLYSVDFDSWPSILIALVTKSIYTHSAIQVEDRIFEASGKKDTLGWAPASVYDGRHVKKIELPVSKTKAKRILNTYRGIKYDYRALRLWCFSEHDKKKYYCFEHCLQFLRDIGISAKEYKRVSSHTLLHILKEK